MVTFFPSVFFELAVLDDTAESGGLHQPGLATQAWQCVLDVLQAEMWLDRTLSQKKIVYEIAFENGLQCCRISAPSDS